MHVNLQWLHVCSLPELLEVLILVLGIVRILTSGLPSIVFRMILTSQR